MVVFCWSSSWPRVLGVFSPSIWAFPKQCPLVHFSPYSVALQTALQGVPSGSPGQVGARNPGDGCAWLHPTQTHLPLLYIVVHRKEFNKESKIIFFLLENSAILSLMFEHNLFTSTNFIYIWFSIWLLWEDGILSPFWYCFGKITCNVHLGCLL